MFPFPITLHAPLFFDPLRSHEEASWQERAVALCNPLPSITMRDVIRTTKQFRPRSKEQRLKQDAEVKSCSH